ncbi:MAG TPA: flagellar assembly protein FliX [Azospirillaceae bacterium]|nr:flagellar assembly protein FliX [Azospirillaceae bacterium]
MKIEGPGQIRSNSVRRTGKSDSTTSGAFAKALGGETSQTGNVNSAGPLTGVDALLALQEVDDATARASKGKMRAEEMLDRLDEIRHSLLFGNLSRGKIIDLARVVKTNRVNVDDPRLAEILDEIDLRAQVELAKLAP